MSLTSTTDTGTYADDVPILRRSNAGTGIGAKKLSDQRRDRRFFLMLGTLGALMIFFGFSRTYYLKPIQYVSAVAPSPRLTVLLESHAAVFTLYVLFYVLQTALISGGRRALHMILGWASVALIPAMVVLGTIAVFWGAKMGHRQNWPDAESAALVNLTELGLFAGVATGGILLRKRPEAHRRLMSLSFMMLLPPAIARSPIVLISPAAVSCTIFAFIFAGPVYDFITRRRIHPAYLGGVLLFVLAGPPVRVALGSTPAWRHFVHWVIGN